MSIRILVADDHNIIRTGLCALLNAEPGLDVVGEASSGEEAIQRAKELAPDMILMDLSMPGIGGIEATRRLVSHHPQVKILILTMHEDKGMLREAVQAGASGYILKRAVKSDLIHAIQVVTRGDLYVHPTLARALFAESEPPPTLRPIQVDTLTAREVEVLRLIARGNTNSQVAQVLSVSVRTIEFHRSNLMSKLNARSRVDLVQYASEHGFLEGD